MLGYSEIGKRKHYTLKDDDLKTEIDTWLADHLKIDLEEAIEFSLSFTADHLNFSTDKCSHDPNKLANEPKANCIGYSAFFNSVMTYVIEQKGWKKA